MAEGVCTVKEMEDHFDALVLADASNALPHYDDQEWMMLPARLIADDARAWLAAQGYRLS